MKKPIYQFATNINSTQETGILDISEPRIVAICNKIDANTIVNALKNYDVLKDTFEQVIHELMEANTFYTEQQMIEYLDAWRTRAGIIEKL